MIDLDDFQRRVDAYFQSGQRQEPGGRIILDLMRALRELHAENERLRFDIRTFASVTREEHDALRAENERLCFQREGLLCRVAELRAKGRG